MIDPTQARLDLAVEAISRADFPQAIEILLAAEGAANAEVCRQPVVNVAGI